MLFQFRLALRSSSRRRWESSTPPPRPTLLSVLPVSINIWHFPLFKIKGCHGRLFWSNSVKWKTKQLFGFKLKKCRCFALVSGLQDFRCSRIHWAMAGTSALKTYINILLQILLSRLSLKTSAWSKSCSKSTTRWPRPKPFSRRTHRPFQSEKSLRSSIKLAFDLGCCPIRSLVIEQRYSRTS